MLSTTLLIVTITAYAKADEHYVETLQPKVLPSPTMGRFLLPTIDSQTRIINGDEVLPNSIIYQVGIFFDLPSGKQGFCGGSLISLNYVLTAAHCTNGSLAAEVVLGAHRIWESEPTQVRMKSYDLYTHELYGTVSGKYDIGLVRLPHAVKPNKYIGMISLPSRQQETETFESKPALVTGWGKTADASTSISDYLKYADTYIMQNKLCTIYFFGMVKDDHICSDGYNSQVSACNGDSGGPLVVDGTLVGLVSFGSGFGCESMWPTVYTRITSYLDWIQEHSEVAIRE